MPTVAATVRDNALATARFALESASLALQRAERADPSDRTIPRLVYDLAVMRRDLADLCGKLGGVQSPPSTGRSNSVVSSAEPADDAGKR